MKKSEPALLAVVLNVLMLNCNIILMESTGTHKQVNCSQLYNCSGWSEDFTEIVFIHDIQVDEDVFISNVKHFSITGKHESGKQDITFRCSNLSSFIVTNSSFIEISNIKIINCGKRIVDYKQPGNIFPTVTSTAIFISNVSSIRIVDVVIGNSCGHGIIGVNVSGNFTLEYIRIYGNTTRPDYCEYDCILFGGMLALNLWEGSNDTTQGDTALGDTAITIRQCEFFNITSNAQSANNVVDENITILPEYINSSAIGLVLHQMGYHYDVKIENVNISNLIVTNAPLVFFSYSINSTSNITIANSLITETNTTYSSLEIGFVINESNRTNEASQIHHSLNILGCKFEMNKAYSILRMVNIPMHSMQLKMSDNTFSKNAVKDILNTKSVIAYLHGSTEFSSNNVSRIFMVSYYFIMNDNSVLNFTNNMINSLYELKSRHIIEQKGMSLLCPIQFTNNVNVTIIFDNNQNYRRLIYATNLLGCAWISEFQNKDNSLPAEVYGKVMNLSNQNITNGLSGKENSICQCDNDSFDCLEVKLKPVFPGQSISLSFVHSSFDIAVYTNFTAERFNAIAPTCNISSYNVSAPQIDLIFQKCTNVSYTIKSSNPNMKTCLLLLSTATKEQTLYAFRVNLTSCPQGFVLDYNGGICKCDPKLLLQISGLSCDISNEAFIRPPYSWISTNSKGVIYTDDCEFDYCGPYPSSVQLTNPDSQCLPSRSGIVCGECAQGLSAVFGTSRCKRCTSYWLFLLPVFAIAGLLLVLALFVLNLTVVDGDMYGFILMVNAVSIHKSRVFPSNNDASYVLVAFSNLDLGIEVCFYNGMTAYAATWLSFMFPIYVLLIVVAMSFASRYFQVIEKITRRRVIPVIATLYLLSYNKLMMITSTVLFSYATVFHLYDMDTDVYWSNDTSIPLFGAKFIMLFVFCLLVFLLVIVPTNILFLFSKFSYRYAFVVNYLKPFLDAYQAPFKENCSYFLGVELLLRASIFACYSLNPQNTGAIYNTLVVFYLAYLCQIKPFKGRLNLFIYCSYMVYLSGFVTLFMRFFPAQPTTYKLIFQLIIYLGLVEFLGIILIHVWKYILCNFTPFIYLESQCNKYKTKLFRSKKKPDKNYQLPLAASCENFQEELLALSPGY